MSWFYDLYKKDLKPSTIFLNQKGKPKYLWVTKTNLDIERGLDQERDVFANDHYGKTYSNCCSGQQLSIDQAILAYTTNIFFRKRLKSILRYA